MTPPPISRQRRVFEPTPSVLAFASRAADSMLSGVVVSDGCALLVDPGVLPDELEELDAFVSRRGAKVEAVLLTHHHWDHVLATSRWPAARRIAHPGLEPIVRQQQADSGYRAMLEEAFSRHGCAVPEAWELLPIDRPAIREDTVRIGRIEGAVLELPGHAPDAIGLLLRSERLLFSADMLDPNELPLPDHDRGLYLESLDRIEELVLSGTVSRLVPGHGWPLASKAEILQQLARDRLYVRNRV